MSEIKRTLKVPIDTSQLIEVRDFIRQAILEGGALAAEADRIILAVDEAVSNVIEHAYRDVQEGEIDISIAISDERVLVEVTDYGEPFDPTNIDPPDLQEHIVSGHKRGLGMFMMRQLMDEVSYQFSEKGINRLRMVKFNTISAGD